MSTEKAATPATAERPRLFVANLPYSMSADEIRALFEAHGAVASVTMPLDYNTRQPRGFAFVEMEVAAEAEAAIGEVNGVRIQGRALAVEWAKERPPRFTPSGRPKGSQRR